MIVSNLRSEFDIYVEAFHLCAKDLKDKKDFSEQIKLLQSKCQNESLEKCILYAQSLKAMPNDIQGSDKLVQLQQDVQTVASFVEKTNFFSSLTSNSLVQNFLGSTNSMQTAFSKLMSSTAKKNESVLALQEIPGPTTDESCLEIIHFLEGFAPSRAEDWKTEWFSYKKKNDSEKQFTDLLTLLTQELEAHTEDIFRALKRRIDNIDAYIKSEYYNKLDDFIEQLDFLHGLIKNQKFYNINFVSRQILKIFQKDQSLLHIFDSLQNQALFTLEENMAMLQQKKETIKDFQLGYQCQKILEFLKQHHYPSIHILEPIFSESTPKRNWPSVYEKFSALVLDYFLDQMRSQLDRPKNENAIGFQTSWETALLKDSLFYLDVLELCRLFCSEKGNLKKMQQFHFFLDKYLHKYPDTPHLGADTLITFIKTILLQAKSPDFLLDILLMNSDTLDLMPYSSAKRIFEDYAPNEQENGGGLRSYLYISLKNGFTALCMPIDREGDECQTLVNRSKKMLVILEHFEAAEDSDDCVVRSIEEKLKRLLSHETLQKQQLYPLYESLQADLIQKLWTKMLNFQIKMAKNSDGSSNLHLVYNPAFQKEAKQWAQELLSEKNSIYQMNKHRLIIEQLSKTYLKGISVHAFIEALIIASDEPRILFEIECIDSTDLQWHFNDNTQAEDRKNDYELLLQVVRKIYK